MLDQTREFREQVLDRAALAEGETLLDVGCGEGMIGLGALERVIFSDISDDLLGFGFGAPGQRAVVGCLRQHVGEPADPDDRRCD